MKLLYVLFWILVVLVALYLLGLPFINVAIDFSQRIKPF